MLGVTSNPNQASLAKLAQESASLYKQLEDERGKDAAMQFRDAVRLKVLAPPPPLPVRSTYVRAACLPCLVLLQGAN